jgi:hypothetical protein
MRSSLAAQRWIVFLRRRRPYRTKFSSMAHLCLAVQKQTRKQIHRCRTVPTALGDSGQSQELIELRLHKVQKTMVETSRTKPTEKSLQSMEDRWRPVSPSSPRPPAPRGNTKKTKIARGGRMPRPGRAAVQLRQPCSSTASAAATKCYYELNDSALESRNGPRPLRNRRTSRQFAGHATISMCPPVKLS